MTTMTLNEDQQKVYDIIYPFTEPKSKRVNNRWVLVSPGGCGKTFLIKYMFQRHPYTKVVLTPTNKACSLYTNENIPSVTIHKFFNSKKVIDPDTGKVEFRLSGGRYHEMLKLIIIDECSMISKDQIEAILKAPCCILFVGDTHQLPPVDEKESEVFNMGFKTLTLTKNMRISKNPDSLSAKYLKDFRENVTIKKKITVDKVDEKLELECIKSGKDVMELAWRNITVARRNKTIREYLFGPDCAEYCVGEKLVFSGRREVGGPTATAMDEHIYRTSDIIVISDIYNIKKTLEYRRCDHQGKDYSECIPCGRTKRKVTSYDLDYYLITDDRGTDWLLPHKDSVANLKKILADYKQYCLKLRTKEIWEKYYSFMGTHSPDLKYAYCMTVHKAQGSEYDYVFVNIDDIRQCRDYDLQARLLYTAVSRMRKYIHFI